MAGGGLQLVKWPRLLDDALGGAREHEGVGVNGERTHVARFTLVCIPGQGKGVRKRGVGWLKPGLYHLASGNASSPSVFHTRLLPGVSSVPSITSAFAFVLIRMTVLRASASSSFTSRLLGSRKCAPRSKLTAFSTEPKLRCFISDSA